MKRETFDQDKIIEEVNELFKKAESDEAKAEILKEFTKCGRSKSEIKRIRSLKIQDRILRPKIKMKQAIRRMRSM